jgi:hypothetical protein
MEQDGATVGTGKMTVMAESWTWPRTPADGPPDAVTETTLWFEADGTQVTDPGRIAVIAAQQEQEAMMAQQNNQSDNGRTYSQAEVDALLAEAGGAGTATAPGTEEGPHLDDPDIRAAKKQQLRDAGVTADDEGLTDDMRAILRERD